MDQYLSAVVISLMTGIFSIITVMIQKRADKVVDKIDEQRHFIEREKRLKKALTDKTEERDSLMSEIMLLILDTNLFILKQTSSSPEESDSIESIAHHAAEIKDSFFRTGAEIKDIKKEYAMLLELNEDYAAEAKGKDK